MDGPRGMTADSVEDEHHPGSDEPDAAHDCPGGSAETPCTEDRQLGRSAPRKQIWWWRSPSLELLRIELPVPLPTHRRRSSAMCAGGPPKPVRQPSRSHARAIVRRATPGRCVRGVVLEYQTRRIRNLGNGAIRSLCTARVGAHRVTSGAWRRGASTALRVAWFLVEPVWVGSDAQSSSGTRYWNHPATSSTASMFPTALNKATFPSLGSSSPARPPPGWRSPLRQSG